MNQKPEVLDCRYWWVSMLRKAFHRLRYPKLSIAIWKKNKKFCKSKIDIFFFFTAVMRSISRTYSAITLISSSLRIAKKICFSRSVNWLISCFFIYFGRCRSCIVNRSKTFDIVWRFSTLKYIQINNKNNNTVHQENPTIHEYFP